MTDTTKQTLESIERCVTAGGASVKTALEAAYQLGQIAGGLAVSEIHMQKLSSLMEVA